MVLWFSCQLVLVSVVLWLPCQVPGVIGSALGMVGPVSVVLVTG